MKFTSLFANKFTLDDLDRPQLIDLFKLLSLPFIDPNYYFILKLHFKGIRNLNLEELQAITWFLLFDQQIVLKTVGFIVDYNYNEAEATDEALFTTEYTTIRDDHTDDKPESSSDDIIELNVGGQRISTFRSTLTVVPDSKLALLFSKDNKNQAKSKDKIHFFDYNHIQFGYLLDQLRSLKRMPKAPAYELNIVAPNVDVRFNFSIMLFELGLNPDHFLTPLVGTHLNLTVDSLIGWKECFRGKYNEPFDGTILTDTCKGNRLLVACRSVDDKNTLIVAGVGKREDIFYPCTPNTHCVTQMKNGTGFYYAKDQAWGFEGRPKDFVASNNMYQQRYYYGASKNSFYVNPCDSSDQYPEYRLCWSFRSNLGRGGGDRCGSSKNLHNTKGWERLIYEVV